MSIKNESSITVFIYRTVLGLALAGVYGYMVNIDSRLKALEIKSIEQQGVLNLQTFQLITLKEQHKEEITNIKNELNKKRNK